jgi:hypothetical protein
VEGERDDESAFGGLNDSVVVQNEVTGGLLDELGLGPDLAVVAGEAHVRAAIDPTVLDAVKHRQFATGEAQERDAHHVVARGVFHDGHRSAPSAALIIGVDFNQSCGALVRRAAVEL